MISDFFLSDSCQKWVVSMWICVGNGWQLCLSLCAVLFQLLYHIARFIVCVCKRCLFVGTVLPAILSYLLQLFTFVSSTFTCMYMYTWVTVFVSFVVVNFLVALCCRQTAFLTSFFFGHLNNRIDKFSNFVTNLCLPSWMRKWGHLDSVTQYSIIVLHDATFVLFNSHC